MDFDTWLIEVKGYEEYEVLNNKNLLFSATELDYLWQEWDRGEDTFVDNSDYNYTKPSKYHYISAKNRNLTPVCGYPMNRFTKEEAISKFLNEYGLDMEYNYSTNEKDF